MTDTLLTHPASDESPARDEYAPSYRRLTDTQRTTILDLAAQGHTHIAIAQLLGIDDSSVNRVVKKYASSRDRAKQRIEASAEPAVATLQKLMRHSAKPDVQYKAAAKLVDCNGLGGEAATAGLVQVAIVLGVQVSSPGVSVTVKESE